MSAAVLWQQLCQAGVELEVADGALDYDAPVGLVTPALVEQIRTEKAPLLAVVSGRFRAELGTWSPEHRDQYEERAAILEYEAGLSRPEAERAAYLEVREAIAAEQELAERAPLTTEEAEELFAWPAGAQGTWQLEAEHRAAQGASRPAAERQALEAVREHLRRPQPAPREEAAPRCTNPRCEEAPNLLGLRSCPNCGRARQGVRSKPAIPSRTGVVREVREAGGLRWTRRLGVGASIEGFVPLEAIALEADQCPSCRARVQPGPGGCPHGGVWLPEGFGAEREDDEEAVELAPVRRIDARPVVSPLTCGGCGCKALGDGGKGACGRCGWRRTDDRLIS